MSNMFSVGDLCGTMYDLTDVGDCVQKHSHTHNDDHITIVARGSLKVITSNVNQEYKAGSIIDFIDADPHELIATEENTRIFNIVKKAGGLHPYKPPELSFLENSLILKD